MTIPDTFLARPENTRIIVVANQKGGVGKTTTTVNLAASLALYGNTVLVIDLDPQGNASTALGIDRHVEDIACIYDVLLNDKALDDVIQQAPFSGNLFCVPATLDLAGGEVELVTAYSRESRLKNAITESEMGFDYILIDCPPSLGLLTLNALVAANEILIPMQCEYYALEGLSQLLKNVDLVRKQKLNTELHISTVLLTMYDGRTNLAEEVANEVRAHFPKQVLKTRIPRSVRISEAPSHAQTVIEYEPYSAGAMAYKEAARELAAQNV